MPEVEAIARQYRESRKTRYPGDIQPDKPIPVHKGQVIGYSGETGVGWPHFHFEVRDLTNRPLNPEKLGLRLRYDREKPVFRCLHFYPEGAFSAIDDRNGSASIQVKRTSPGMYVAPDVKVSGPFLLSVSVDDRDGRKGPLGIRELRMEIDGRETYRFSADMFSFDNWWQSSAIYDLSETRLSPSRYAYNLFRIPGSSLEAQTGVSVLNLSEGTHAYTIQTEDFNGNLSVLTGTLNAARPTVARELTSPGGTNYLVDRNLIQAGADGPLAPVTIGSHVWQVSSYDNLQRTITVGKTTLSIAGYNKDPRLLFVRRIAPTTIETGMEPVAETFVDTAPGLCFFRDLHLGAPLPDTDGQKAGWYWLDVEKGKWKYLDSAEESDAEGTIDIAASHYRTAQFGMFLDKARPVIVGQPFRYRDRLAWKVTDVGTGIDPEHVFLTMPDGTRIPIDFDPDRNIAFIEMEKKQGTYLIEVQDRAGNTASAKGRYNGR